jgi:hypothetical protein
MSGIDIDATAGGLGAILFLAWFLFEPKKALCRW